MQSKKVQKSLSKLNVNKRREQFASIDVVKFIMSVCVIAIHTHALESYKGYFVAKAVNLIIWSAVPFFFMASGFLIYNKSNKLYKGEKLKILELTIRKYFFSYIICSIAYLPLSYKAYKGMEMKGAIIQYISDFLFLGQHRNDWIMWYLLSSIYAFFFCYILTRLNISREQIIYSVLIIMLISYNIDVLTNVNSNMLNDKWRLVQNVFLVTTQSGRVFRGMFFVPAGWLYAMGRNKNGGVLNRGYMWILLAACAAGSIISESQYVTKNIFLSIFSVILFSIVVNLKFKINNKIALFFRSMSKAIYFSHMYVFVVLTRIVWGKRTFGMKSFALVTISTCFLSFIWIVLVLPQVTSVKNKIKSKKVC